MEHELIAFFALAVETVAYDGAAQSFWVGRVESELMGAAGDGSEFYSGLLFLKGYSAPFCLAPFPLNRVVNLVGAIVWIEPER